MNIRSHFVWLAALTPLSTLICAAQKSSDTPPPGVAVAQSNEPFEKIFNQHARDGFSGSVIVAKGDQILFSKGTGFADQAAKRLNDGQTAFCVGSITKLFTSIAILRLEQDGKLSVADTVSKFFIKAPKDKAGITIDQLLTHTAGLSDYIDRPGENGDFTNITKEEALSRVFSSKLLFTPGSSNRYSNSGYTLLAAIVERASGTTYEKYLRNNIFAPADMTKTGFYGDHIWAGNVAAGVGAKKEADPNTPDKWPAPFWSLKGAGGVVSNPPDMLRLIRKLKEFKILNMAEVGKLFAGHARSEGGPAQEGYGWIATKTRAGDPLFNVAGGSDYGFRSVMLVLPTQDVVVYASSNTAYVMRDMVLALVKAANGMKKS